MSGEKVKKIKVGMVVYDQFATLDYAGPVQAFGSAYVMVDGKPDYTKPYFKVYTVAITKEKPIKSCEGVSVNADLTFEEATSKKLDILLVVGGLGNRTLINDEEWTQKLLKLYESGDETQIITSVCTGASFLAKLGILDNRKATTNKLAWDWVISFSNQVDWQRQARFVISPPLKHGKAEHCAHHSPVPVESSNIPYKTVVTSSGVSAGTDMALRLVQMKLGCEKAKIAMRFMEYVWDNDPSNDPFCNWPNPNLEKVCLCDHNNNNNNNN